MRWLPLLLCVGWGCGKSDTGDSTTPGDTTPADADADADTDADTDTDVDTDTSDTDTSDTDTSDTDTDTDTDTAPPPVPIVDLVDIDNVLGHLEELQAIGDANDGIRAAGSPGYDASVDYVVDVFEAAGLSVTRQPFPVFSFESGSPAELEQISPSATTYTVGTDFGVLTYSGAGDVTAPMQTIDVVIPPGKFADTSDSGCDTKDFASFVPGNIAVIQRGSCTFAEKAANAEAAGAVAVLIFNEGQDGRRGVVNGTLDGGAPANVPVLGTTYAFGATMVTMEGMGEVTLRVAADTAVVEHIVENVIADWPGIDPARTVMLGAHLDSVEAGAGINDNGSGSAVLLEVATQLAASGLEPANGVRFALWGAEELGLVGSEVYVDDLDAAGIAELVTYLNFDMIGSPNGVPGVFDGDGSEFPATGPPGSEVVEQWFVDAMNGLGWTPVPVELTGRSDYASFADAGVPVGGLFTGAEQPKTVDQEKLYGGTAGMAYDPCYHQQCDDLANVDFTLLEANLFGVAIVTEQAAMWKGSLSD